MQRIASRTDDVAGMADDPAMRERYSPSWAIDRGEDLLPSARRGLGHRADMAKQLPVVRVRGWPFQRVIGKVLLAMISPQPSAYCSAMMMPCRECAEAAWLVRRWQPSLCSGQVVERRCGRTSREPTGLGATGCTQRCAFRGETFQLGRFNHTKDAMACMIVSLMPWFAGKL